MAVDDAPLLVHDRVSQAHRPCRGVVAPDVGVNEELHHSLFRTLQRKRRHLDGQRGQRKRRYQRGHHGIARHRPARRGRRRRERAPRSNGQSLSIHVDPQRTKLRFLVLDVAFDTDQIEPRKLRFDPLEGARSPAEQIHDDSSRPRREHLEPFLPYRSVAHRRVRAVAFLHVEALIVQLQSVDAGTGSGG